MPVTSRSTVALGQRCVIRAGAEGYQLKDMEPEQLLARVRDALEGRTVISETLGEVGIGQR